MQQWETQGHKKILIGMGRWKPDCESQSLRLAIKPQLTYFTVTDQDREASKLLHKHHAALAVSFRPTLRSLGATDAEVIGWTSDAEKELRLGCEHCQLAVSLCCFARLLNRSSRLDIQYQVSWCQKKEDADA